MELLLNFMVENYIWIIIIGIVVLMTIIGYIADKTDFGKESIKKQKKEKVEPAFDTDEFVDDTVTPNSMVEEPEKIDKKALRQAQKEEARKAKEEAKRQKEEAKRAREEEKRQQKEALEQEKAEVNQPEVETSSEDVPSNETLSAPEERSVEQNVVEENPTLEEQPKSDLFEPMEEPALEVPEEPKKEMEEKPQEEYIFETPEEKKESDKKEKSDKKEESEDIPEIDLPSIESLDKELNEDTEDDDVWKF